MKKLFQLSGVWNIIYLLLFYVSMTLTIIFVYVALHSWRWVSFKADFINRSLMTNDTKTGKCFLAVLAVFFILNTIYLIRNKR